MSKCKHEFRSTTKKSYYKLNGKQTGIGLPAYDQSIEYVMLYCIYCTDKKEVVSADHRQKV